MHTSTYLKAKAQLGERITDIGVVCASCKTAFVPHPKKNSDICGWCKVKKEAFSSLMAE